MQNCIALRFSLFASSMVHHLSTRVVHHLSTRVVHHLSARVNILSFPNLLLIEPHNDAAQKRPIPLPSQGTLVGWSKKRQTIAETCC